MEDKIFITQQEYDTVRKSLQEAPHMKEKVEMLYLLTAITSTSDVQIENFPSPACEEALPWYDLLFKLCEGRMDEQELAHKYTNKGLCCYNLKRYEEAAECFKMAINKNSNRCTPYVELSTLYFCGKVGLVNGEPDFATSLVYAQKGFPLMTEEDKCDNAAFLEIIGEIYCTEENVKNLEEGRKYLDEAVAQGDEDAVRLRKEVFGY